MRDTVLEQYPAKMGFLRDDYLMYNDCWTDNDVIQDMSSDSNLNKEQIDNYYDAGWNIYGQVRKCNLVIEKMEENTTFRESERKSLVAQLKP